MRKVVLLILLLLAAENVLAAPRVIRTYKPVPYNRSVNPFVRPHSGYWGGHYNRYYGRNYLRPYYYGSNFGRIYGGTYYPVYTETDCCRAYTPSQQNYVSQEYSTDSKEPDTMFSKIFTMRRTLEKDSREYTEPDAVYRLKSLSGSEILPVSSFQNSENDSRLSKVEKSVYGRSFEHQPAGLRLNRLEKEFFNKTFPSMSSSERIDNIMVNYTSLAIPSEKLSLMEKRVFNNSGEGKTAEERIVRLEEKVFGTIQSGDLYKRFQNLQNALDAKTAHNPPVSSYGTCYGGYVPQTGWRNTLSRFFSGYPTGVTPPLTPFGMPDYGFGGSGIREGYTDNRGGYAYNNTVRSGGMGVHILD